MLWYIVIGIACFCVGMYGGFSAAIWTLRKKGLLLEDDDDINGETAKTSD